MVCLLQTHGFILGYENARYTVMRFYGKGYGLLPRSRRRSKRSRLQVGRMYLVGT